MAEPLTIRKLIERVTSGDIRIPAFQRGYVWNPEQVAFLIDSLYKGYPIGTVFLWNTDSRLKNEKLLGNFKLPEPKKDYPVNYVLDGQQRITSIFSVFQNELQPVGNLEWVDIYFDIESDVNPQESNFLALTSGEVDPVRHFPMNTLFDSVKYRQATQVLDAPKIAAIDKLQERFKEVLIPVQEFETNDRETVSIVFERINRAGTELDTYQLLTAWSWSEEFDLQENIQDLSTALVPFGFKEIGSDKDLQLKCFSGLVKGSTLPSDVLELKGDEIRSNFDKVKSGMMGAIDFLRKELNVHTYGLLPYPAMIVSLTTFFATDRSGGHPISNNQRKEILRWFWHAIFSRKYSAGVGKVHASDLKEMNALKANPDYRLALPTFSLTSEYFLKNTFNSGAINTKSFILLLASVGPVSLLSGAKVDLAQVLKIVNRNEFHHIFPQKHLERLGVESRKINLLANLCFLSSADNQKIKDKDPKVYKDLIPSSTLPTVLAKGICPSDSLDISYDEFLAKRATMLAAHVNTLLV